MCRRPGPAHGTEAEPGAFDNMNGGLCSAPPGRRKVTVSADRRTCSAQCRPFPPLSTRSAQRRLPRDRAHDALTLLARAPHAPACATPVVVVLHHPAPESLIPLLAGACVLLVLGEYAASRIRRDAPKYPAYGW
ncbi:HPP family protein [Streptomyces sp. NBC_00083]|uniref:HPP family protein n=1 Tax=Streptomyces sp. NBC_00083 TaxID=2975647 RepID=UPI0022598310|nr:HPP family protein [Streptomyces sp. NBC_00083]MCX5387185.1 HPP family protein [Streptomyces sp. NBC_00083]